MRDCWTGYLRAAGLLMLPMAPLTAGAQQPPDPVLPLVGYWDLPGTLTKLRIHADHTVDHSSLGAGSIQHEDTSYFSINYRLRRLTCHYEVRKYTDTELTFTMATRPGDSDCELGALRRAPESEPPPQQPPAQPKGKASETGSDERKLIAGTVLKDCDDCPELVVVPAGKFSMGSPQSEAGRLDIEGPQRVVDVSSTFAVGRYAITRDQFDSFVKTTGHLYEDGCNIEQDGRWVLRPTLNFHDPGFRQDGRHPVVCINWDDANAYVKWLTGKTGKTYRLITEAEREYISRAGTSTAYWWGDAIRPELANYDKREQAPNRGGQAKVANAAQRPAARTDSIIPESPQGGTVPVHLYQPNPWGLYQVHGNVAEWVEDCWNRSYMGAPRDRSAVRTGDCGRRVLRGGAWSYWPSDIRAAYRESAPKDQRYFHVGFRVARDLEP
jgi:formylglycine-generating enzyme required for sulfatase activity